MAEPSSACLVARSGVRPVSNYLEYRDQLREDFWFSCAYCSVSEIEARGIAFEVDHYRPQARFGALRDDYSNLFWSCDICNGLKGDLPPDEDYERGFRFLKVDEDDPTQHLELEETFRVRPLTPIGKLTEAALYLNSDRLFRLRRARAELYDAENQILIGLRALKGYQIERVRKQARAYFERVRRELGDRAEELSQFTKATFVVADWNRSPLIDRDEDERRTASAERRRFLKIEMKAYKPETWTADAPPAAKQLGQSAKKSRRRQRR
ncbi:HNH endonuclease [Sorangium sp. So ce887]|uniref:HNH endonuclease n=1 Tax=Sorangium sp. So ce887 TaxID=3133324 RepID=UPI003F5DA4C7